MTQVGNLECPAGSGKKIKFCCPDLVGDWEKLARLMDAQQYHAGLELIEQIQRRSGDRACLWTIKLDAMYRLKKFPEAQQAVEEFLQKYPGHPAALMEKAYLLAMQEQAEEAYRCLLQGMNAIGSSYPVCTFRTIYLVAVRLLEAGHFLPAFALFRFGAGVGGGMDEEFREAVQQLAGNIHIPLVLREAFRWRNRLLADSPAADQFVQIGRQVEEAHWLDATEALQQLTETYPDLPGLWWHLALMRGWILDTSGAIEALRRYARLNVPRDEAILAEALAMALSEDPLEDQVPSYKLIYTPENESDLQAAFALCKQMTPIFGPLPSILLEENGEIPPRACYLLVNRPIPRKEEPLSEACICSVMGLAALYGRQTDREARLVVYEVYEHFRSEVEALFQQFVGQGLREGVVVERLGQISATHLCFRAESIFLPPEGQKTEPKQEQERRLAGFLRRWADQPLGIFQGRSPRQAAQDPQCQTTLEAALLWVEDLALRLDHPWDRQRARQEVGLPPVEPIDPQTISLRELPLFRWIDVDLSRASDEQISDGYVYSTYFQWEPGIERFAAAFLQRPSLAQNPVWLSACYSAAQAAMPSEKAAELIEQGRQRALQSRRSCAPWDLLALEHHLQREEPDQVNPLVRHLVQEHQYEPGVLERILEILDSFGLLAAEQTQQEAASETSGGLWTPGQEPKPAGEKKLWTPGMP